MRTGSRQRREGYEVITAANGLEALNQAVPRCQI